ncbi:hypothetical protein MMC31_006617 [Peltigera leucophlebia]|nr:hypothetical protein [Peltigera leucophlebia]
MYSHVGILIGAVVSALLGLYVFVPDGGLRLLYYLLSSREPIEWDVPAIMQPLFSEEGGELWLPSWVQKLVERTDWIEDMERQGYSDEDITRMLRGQPAIDGPIGPRYPPGLELGPPPRVAARPELDQPPLSVPRFDPDSLPPIVPFPEGLALIFFALCQYFAPFVLPCLIPVALVHQIYALRKMRKLYKAEKRKAAKLREELEAWDKKDGQGLPDAKGLPAKRRRSGKGKSQKPRKAEKRRKREAKMEAMRDWKEEETHEKK